MKKKRLTYRSDFEIVMSNRHAQVATMTLPPQSTEGGPDNCHRGCDQWLIVIAGSGLAIVDGRRNSLRPGDAVLIARGQMHEIRNTGRRLLKTLSVYVPPAYRSDGTALPRGRC